MGEDHQLQQGAHVAVRRPWFGGVVLSIALAGAVGLASWVVLVWLNAELSSLAIDGPLGPVQ